MTWRGMASTINYEVICAVGHRVPRVYYKNNKVVDVVNYLTAKSKEPLEEYIPAKTIVTRAKSGWFGMDYNMNVYRGCSHGCIVTAGASVTILIHSMRCAQRSMRWKLSATTCAAR